MASTYSPRLKLELMATGANANTWGNNTNTNLSTVDAFTGGYIDIDISANSGGTYTLSSNNADPNAEASNKVLDLHGTLTGNTIVEIPQVENNYLVYNNTAGSYNLNIGSGGSGVQIPQGEHKWVYCDGTNVTLADLSNTNAASLTSGTLADARLSSNVVKITGTSNITISGTLTAATIVETSSITYKENIRSLDATTEAILSMDPVIYDRKDGSQKNEVGLIAEEVYKIAPELVQLKDGNPEGIKYTKLAVYLLHAIKDLKKDLDMLKKR